ncbi:MAG: hypothetical protein KJO91_09595 [Gammaproteobacteria bacterium]|nr:hypothetical protein [Gammaproteobacteria bacterium]
MKISKTIFLAALVTLSTVFAADAGTRAIIEVENIQGDNVEKHVEILTFDEDRFRIDFVGEDQKITDETSYIMTLDGGKSWVMGDKPKDKFYCSEVNTEEFFKNLGAQVSHAVDRFNVKSDSPEVKQVLEEPGPDILGFKTTHVQLETHTKAHAWFLFFKFEYKVKIVSDLWYTTDVEIHPIRKRWIRALTKSGNNIIDDLFTGITSKLPGPVLKKEAVMDITNVRKKSVKTEKQVTKATSVEEITPEEMDKLFKKPQCVKMDDDEIQEKGKTLLGAGKIML